MALAENTLALDLSTTSTGIAYVIDGVLVHDSFKTKGDSQEERIAFMSYSVMAVLQRLGFSYEVLLEDAPPVSRPSTRPLMMLHGLIRHKLWVNKIPFAVVHNATWKKQVVGSGNATKDEILAYVNKTYSLDLPKKLQDEADAICILEYAGLGGVQ